MHGDMDVRERIMSWVEAPGQAQKRSMARQDTYEYPNSPAPP